MYSYIKICPTYSLTMCHIADYALVSLCNIVMMEDAWELALVNQIGYLTNVCLGFPILLRNGSILGTSICISIFK